MKLALKNPLLSIVDIFLLRKKKENTFKVEGRYNPSPRYFFKTSSNVVVTLNFLNTSHRKEKNFFSKGYQFSLTVTVNRCYKTDPFLESSSGSDLWLCGLILDIRQMEILWFKRYLKCRVVGLLSDSCIRYQIQTNVLNMLTIANGNALSRSKTVNDNQLVGGNIVLENTLPDICHCD